MSAARIMVMGDPHAHPDYDNDRFERAARICRARKAHMVVCMGDWFDYSSLCKHSSRREREGGRERDDTAVGHDALHRFQRPWIEEAKRRKKAPLSLLPRRVMIQGNHDIRPDAVEDPALEGSLAPDQWAPFRESGWELHDFKRVWTFRGWAFSHYMPSGTMGRPLGGSTSSLLAKNLIARGHQSAIVGHDHRFGHAKDERWDGRKLHGFTAGCYVHHEYDAYWCRNTRPMWDVGLLFLDIDGDGNLSRHEWVTDEEIRRRFG